MKWSILTLFPEIIQSYTEASIVGRAQKSGLIQVEAINPRDFTTDPHKKVDDSPFGGGAGMVMTCQPLEDAYQSILPLKQPARVLLMSPGGKPFTHPMAMALSECSQIVILCGHYEGIDHRIFQLIPELEEVSVGDFVLTGGELPALCIVDAVSRQLPGVVQKQASVEEDSFFHGLLDHPHYTRPAQYKGIDIPEVLGSGNHGAIRKWRRQASLEKTFRVRPDLLASAPLTKDDQAFLQQ
ncbi:MAG: tRNA (guanosine(37)-N1)-methyltransferase TrmD, partial [Cyanobacteria bacterium]|nr:tRNA (guanosine(37)-N1)-methyltransferase TrmD [Cyanobacteriota bacterium]